MHRTSPISTSGRVRNQSGISMVLVAVGFGFLVILLVIVFQFLTLNSSSREVRNAVDAAALNVSKKVGTLKVGIGNQFNDVADKGGLVGMSNINRVWGKAYLINANAEAIQKEGLSNQYTAQNADEAFRVAQAANDSLVDAVTNKQALDQFFNEMSNLRKAKLMGNSSDLKTVDGPGWDVGMVDRGAPSNLKFEEKQIPKGATVAPSSANHVSGYIPFQANGKNFCFASFIPNEMPHLTTDSNFNANDRRTAPLNGNPVPNAFRANGINLGSKYSLSASASSVANPRHEYRLAIPHAYVKIVIKNMAIWQWQSKSVAPNTFYKCEPETQQGIKNYQLKDGRILNGYASLGNEYKGANLLLAMTAFKNSNYQEMFERMLQRIKEIKHDYTMQELKNLLEKQQPADGFVIYPVYSTQDLTDPKIQIMRIDPDQPTLPIEWMNSPIQMDGVAATIVKESPQKDEPNYCWPVLMGGNPDCPKYSLVSGKIDWTPGTGYSPCLGVLRLSRTTLNNFGVELIMK